MYEPLAEAAEAAAAEAAAMLRPRRKHGRRGR